MELVASEPLIREPSGLCWDERGRLYVCELHGYNLEGQYDIDELNKTGQLDREVRRIQANPRAKEAALAETFGTIKLLTDTDGDGQMDRAVVFADHLPPCYGISPARGGLIVACAPDIIFLADRDGDGHAEVREKALHWFCDGSVRARHQLSSARLRSLALLGPRPWRWRNHRTAFAGPRSITWERFSHSNGWLGH
jgi:glucose/arabinose dehydrogenase